ncbi:hypothetical protein, partial, partial [Absidia glauca]
MPICQHCASSPNSSKKKRQLFSTAKNLKLHIRNAHPDSLVLYDEDSTPYTPAYVKKRRLEPLTIVDDDPVELVATTLGTSDLHDQASALPHLAASQLNVDDDDNKDDNKDDNDDNNADNIDDNNDNNEDNEDNDEDNNEDALSVNMDYDDNNDALFEIDSQDTGNDSDYGNPMYSGNNNPYDIYQGDYRIKYDIHQKPKPVSTITSYRPKGRLSPLAAGIALHVFKFCSSQSEYISLVNMLRMGLTKQPSESDGHDL